jgi:MFS family permease
MTRPIGAVGYRAVLRLPGVPRAFTAAILGRLSYATVSLSLLLVVQSATGSYLAAGAALGVFGLAGLVMPLKSRLIDRFGQRRTLPILSAGLAAALITIAACAAGTVRAEGVYVLLGGAAGLAAPPLGPSMRAVWAALTPDPAARQRAYGLDSVVEETLYAVGPLLVGVVVAVSSARTALAATAVLNLVGSIGMATAPAAPAGHRTRAGGPRPGLLGPFRGPGFGLLAAAMVGIGLGTGPIDLAIVARAHSAGHTEGAAYVLAALSVGSALGGLVWGHLTHRRATSTRLGLLVAAMAVGAVAAALSPTLPLLALVFTLTGAVEAPAFITAYVAADELAPPPSRTEATTWVTTSSNLGVSLGSAAAGLLVDRSGATSALLAGAVVLALTAAAVLTTGDRLDRRTHRISPGPR